MSRSCYRQPLLGPLSCRASSPSSAAQRSHNNSCTALTVASPSPLLPLLFSLVKKKRNFGDFQEPHYRNYIATPLGPLFEEAGLKCGMKVRWRRRAVSCDRCRCCCAAVLLCCCAAVLLCCCAALEVSLLGSDVAPLSRHCPLPLTLLRVASAGVQVVGSSTKSLSFFKPLEDPKPQQEAKPQEAVKPQEDDMFAVGGSAQAAAVSAAAGVAAEAQEDE